jgi:2-octaprenylphenol hydroxylase
MQKFDIIVVGGGLVGATFVLDLAYQNPKLEIGLLEPKPVKIADLTDKLDNKIYAISSHNLEYLARIGGLPDEDRMGIIQKMDVSGDSKSNLLLDAKLVHQFCLAKTVEYGYLQKHLYEKLQDLINVHFIYGQIENIVVNEQYAKIECGDARYTAQLVVGSDGANSVVRKYAEVETQVIDYEQGGVVANFECELPHKNIAYQWFNPGNTLAYLPLPGNKISIVWSHPDSQELVNLDDKALCERVAAVSGHKLGNLKLITPAAVFPLRLYMVKKLYASRIVLIGDAAHTIHPLAGQGVNLGFADAQLLASIIANVPQYQLGDESLLAKYNAKRLPIICQMQLTCHGLHNLFNIRQLPASYIRNFGLNLVNKLSVIKKHLIYSANKY